jgi:hypothetical protein
MLAASAYLNASCEQAPTRRAEAEFYRGIETSNGTKKATDAERLVQMDDLFFKTLARLDLTPRTVMDIGVSSGVTTVDWLRAFEDRGHNIEMIATDFVMSVYIHKLGKNVKALTERNGYLLQIEVFGNGIRTYRRWRDYFLGGWIWRNLLCAFVRSRLPRTEREGPYKFVSPHLRDRQDVQLLDDDILAPNPANMIGCADVVRVANLMQSVYFTDAQMRRMAVTVRERCRGEGSLVIICRDLRGHIEGSILRLASRNQFVVEARLGRGSEAEPYFVRA